jgi:hypothetical protein
VGSNPTLSATTLLFTHSAGTAIPPGTLEEVLAGVEHAFGGDRADLDEWESTVHDYGHRLAIRAAGSLIENLAADIIAVGHLLNRRLPPLEQAGLLRVSAGLSGLLAIELTDAGDGRAARISYGTARRAADASCDRELRVWVRGRAAQDSYFSGRSGQVVTGLADEAIDIADGRPSAGLARAYSARTYVACDRGDTAVASAALSDLKRTFDRLPDGGLAGQTPFAFRESQLAWDESYLFARTGDNRAEATLERARALYPPAASAPLTNLSLMHAMSLVKAREIDAGLHQALDTLQSGPQRECAGSRLLAGHIVEALPTAACALPAARELRALVSAT